MRLVLASAAVVAAIAAAGLFGWQQSEISHLRAEVARQSPGLPLRINRTQGPAVGASSLVARSAVDAPGLSADERRFILSQYRDVLATMNLPPTKASRLQDLLTERIAVALDAQEAAAREGFAEGSPEMTRAESSAISGVDRQIAGLLGSEDDRRLIWLTGASSQPAVMPAPASAPAPVVVNVITQAPAPVYADAAYPSTAPIAYASPDYSSYPPPYYAPAYYPYGYETVVIGRPFARSFAGERFGGERGGAVRPSPPAFGSGGGHGARRTR